MRVRRRVATQCRICTTPTVDNPLRTAHTDVRRVTVALE